MLRYVLAAVVALVVSSPALAADKVTFSYVVPVTIYGDLLLGIDKGFFA